MVFPFFLPPALTSPIGTLLAAAAAAPTSHGPGATDASHGAAAKTSAAESLHGSGTSAVAGAAHATGMDTLTISAVIIFFLLLLLVAFFAPKIVEYAAHYDRIGSKKALNPSTALRSFSSGLAVAYVFVLLLPEFQVFQDKLIIPWLNAFQLSLIGLVCYKGLQHFCLLLANKRSESMGDWAFVSSKKQERLLGFRVSTYVFVVYASLVLLTLPFQLDHFVAIVDKTLYLVTFFLHLGFNLIGLYEEDERQYHKFVPYVVSGVLTLALVLTLFSVLSTGALLTALAFLAGIIIFSVFRNELPTAEKSSFVWFGSGVAFFAIAVAIASRASAH